MAPETQKIVCLFWIRELQCTMLSKVGLSSDTMNTLRKSKKLHKQLTATGSSANKRGSNSFCSWSGSVRNSAITRWNANDSIASQTLLTTRKFIWVKNGMPTNEEATAFVHDLDLFATVQLLDETPTIPLLTNHKWVKNGNKLTGWWKSTTCTTDNLVLLVVSRLSSYSSSILSSTSRSKGSVLSFQKLGTLLDPVTPWSDKHAYGKPMLTDHDEQATGNREPAD